VYICKYNSIRENDKDQSGRKLDEGGNVCVSEAQDRPYKKKFQANKSEQRPSQTGGSDTPTKSKHIKRRVRTLAIPTEPEPFVRESPKRR